jgi:rhodanese-related sulfurtransferase
MKSGFFARLLDRSRRDAARWIEPADLERRLAAGERVLLLDVRGADEFAGPLGHIDGAVNLPLPELPAHLGALAGDRRSIVAICLTDKRSARAAADLRAAGHHDVAVLRGGMDRWRREAIGGPAD